ncbi:TonB family protein [Dysgonomonas sp. PFB1-18]|uniref:energy transducer TonB n=1 Tax=unclassified Dysgonomonas TaxID=2630389 RepID=UPI002472FBB3|nr:MULTISPECIES: energy transducer TonB [unclassified Dysgonomonas]MDH6307431.1 TonB family protein [Dysgonomonas sp. PF1-14]MDH6337349.1 TonB family protein [Dysgonomonas sp. PF1-16]MDH6379273.1 TonB family protein [Dysgonomonas sp. PFB1-18]MDH6396089.1 TonB family protein [Dysgonomonas sp. PF1-23]
MKRLVGYVLLKYFVIIFICISFSENIKAQDTIYVIQTNKILDSLVRSGHVVIKVDQPPVFENGKKMKEYIEENVRYPDGVNTDSLASKTVFLKYTITDRGNAEDILVAKGLTPEFDAEAIRLISSMPQMVPGKKDKKDVSTVVFHGLRFPKIKIKEEYEDKKPQFVGGEKVMQLYIANKLKYPKEALKRKAEGRVIVRFIVDKTGELKDIEVVKGIDYSLNTEAVRVVKGMPNWEPGMTEGKPVSVHFTLPIVFRLRKDMIQDIPGSRSNKLKQR